KEWVQGHDPDEVGDQLADKLLAQGAERILAELRG
ncbi:MAG: hypothetical protein K0Q81_2189, partial [Paenibacillus sp.]|nr:hypothetical protein [Paenibacillus sp.]